MGGERPQTKRITVSRSRWHKIIPPAVTWQRPIRWPTREDHSATPALHENGTCAARQFDFACTEPCAEFWKPTGGSRSESVLGLTVILLRRKSPTCYMLRYSSWFKLLLTMAAPAGREPALLTHARAWGPAAFAAALRLAISSGEVRVVGPGRYTAARAPIGIAQQN